MCFKKRMREAIVLAFFQPYSTHEQVGGSASGHTGSVGVRGFDGFMTRPIVIAPQHSEKASQRMVATREDGVGC